MVSVGVDKMYVYVDKNWAVPRRFFQSLPIPVELVCSRWQNRIGEVITRAQNQHPWHIFNMRIERTIK
jgi:hypothetical protein